MSVWAFLESCKVLTECRGDEKSSPTGRWRKELSICLALFLSNDIINS